MSIDSFIIVAIDGGAASGKSSTARLLAEKLNLLHVDTGAHYRALTSEFLRKYDAILNEKAILKYLSKIKLDTKVVNRMAILTINGKAIENERLRSQKVNENVSIFSAVPAIRQVLFEYQQSQAKIAKQKGFHGLVMEGRDIGSIIFPSADYKFFLEADLETRTKRRGLEGQVDMIGKRDQFDAQRVAAPLKCPISATRIDTSRLSLNEVVEKILTFMGKSEK